MFNSGLFVKYGSNSPEVIAIVYVDNVIFLGPDILKTSMSKDSFKAAWKCRDLRTTSEFLKIHIQRKGTVIILDQQAYLKKILKQFRMHNSKTAPTPLPSDYTPSINTEPVDEKLHNKYQQLISSLLYLMIGT